MPTAGKHTGKNAFDWRASTARDCICAEENMKALCLGVVVAVGLTLPAFGQASLKDQLVGAWTLVSCANPFPWCAGNNGTAIYEANGRYAVIMAARGRPKVTVPGGGPAGADQNALTPEQYKAVAAGFFANFGTWSMDGAIITHHVDGALFPNIEGTDFGINTLSISGDQLTVTPRGGGQPSSVWRRVKN